MSNDEGEDEDDNGVPPNGEAGSAVVGIDQQRHGAEEKEKEDQVRFIVHIYRCYRYRGVQNWHGQSGIVSP